MSAARKNIFAVLPATQRGQSVHLGKDPKGKNVLYTNGRSVIIRDLSNPVIADQYVEHIQNATVARYAPSGFYIASGDMAGNVRIWDTTQAEHALKQEVKVIAGEIKDIAWDSESKRIIAVGNGQEKYGAVFFADGGSSCGEISGHSKVVNSCDFKPTRPYRAVTVSDDLCVNYYEGPPFKYKSSNKDHQRFINCVRFNADGNTFVTVSADGQAFLFDGKTGEKTGALGGGAAAHSGSIFSCCWSDDGTKLMTCSADRTVKLWDVASQTATTTFEFGGNVDDQQVGCLWQGQYLVSLSLSGDMNYLDASSPSKPIKVIKGHTKPLMSVAVSKDSNTFFTGDVSGRICSWDVSTGTAESLEGGHTNQATALVATGDNLVSIGMDDTVRFTPATSKSVSSNFFKSETQPKALAARNDVAIVAAIDNLLVVKGSTKLSSIPIKWTAYSAAISVDGTEVAIGSENDIVLYSFNGTTLTEKKRLQGNRGQITALAYSHDGTKLAAGDSNRQVIIYDTSSYEVKLSDWVFHQAKITTLAWSPSSLHVASGSIDTHVFIWSIDKPSKKIQIKFAHYSSVNAVAFLNDTTLVTAGQDGCAKTWSITHH